MNDASKITTFVALVLFVVAIISLKDGLPNFTLMSDTVLCFLGGLLIWRVVGSGCWAKRGYSSGTERVA